jgi:two-component system alkaline phosphatase synthesis response regulator PhoP
MYFSKTPNQQPPKMNTIEKSILLVDDEVGLAEMLKFNLELDGFAVTMVHDGLTAIGMLATQVFDLVVLDVMLPEVDGYHICKQFRQTNTQTPVIFLSAKGNGSDRIHGLRLGANDYLAKPFEYDELVLRINNLISVNVTQNGASEILTYAFGNCSIDFEKMLAIGNKGLQIDLSKIEFQMMKFFVLNKNRVVTRDEIYKHIWGYRQNEIPTSRTLDNFVVVLRKYFERDPSNPEVIISVRGVGYKFVG